MEFRDLKRQYKSLRVEMDAAMAEVMADTNFISGRQVRELEEELAEYVGVKHCISCANGTDALTLALLAWGIGENDAVFVPDFTFFSTAEVVSYAGAEPVFVDVDEDSYTIDCAKLERAIERTLAEGRLRPRAVIPVDLFGQPADYGKLLKLAGKYGLQVLEDGAQGFGGSRGGRKNCSFGDISTTSFFPAKPLGCYGDGGALFTEDAETAALLSSYRVHGKGASKYDNVRIGMNSRLDTLQAAVLQVKLRAFKEHELEEVNRRAEYYTAQLKGYVKTPVIGEGNVSSWAQYVIRLKDLQERDGLQSFLREAGIPTMVYYAAPLHRQKAFAHVRVQEGELGVSSRLTETVLALPIHPYLLEEEQQRVIEKIQEYLR